MEAPKSPSPPPTAPQPNPETVPSQRYARLQRLYRDALKATLAANSYENFAACFPTPAKYCPRALEGVWAQLNTRLSEECTKDFEKICHEREINRALASWEQLIEDARLRKEEADAKGEEPGRPVHLMSADELHTAFLAPTLVKAEHEVQSKLEKTQQENRQMMMRIEKQRVEMQDLVKQMEKMVEDVEAAAKVVEGDEVRQELKSGMDVKMIG